MERLAQGPGWSLFRLPLPGTPLDDGGPLTSPPKGSGTGWVRLLRFDGGPKRRLWSARFTHPRSASLAERRWNLVCVLRAAGVVTPEPLAVVAEGSAVTSPRSAIVWREAEEGQRRVRSGTGARGAHRPATRARRRHDVARDARDSPAGGSGRSDSRRTERPAAGGSTLRVGTVGRSRGAQPRRPLAHPARGTPRRLARARSRLTTSCRQVRAGPRRKADADATRASIGPPRSLLCAACIRTRPSPKGRRPPPAVSWVAS